MRKHCISLRSIKSYQSKNRLKSNIELDEQTQTKLKQLEDEMKDTHHVAIGNDEQIQLINKRLSTLEGGSAGVLGFLERVDQVLINFFFLSNYENSFEP